MVTRRPFSFAFLGECIWSFNPQLCHECVVLIAVISQPQPKEYPIALLFPNGHAQRATHRHRYLAIEVATGMLLQRGAT